MQKRREKERLRGTSLPGQQHLVNTNWIIKGLEISLQGTFQSIQLSQLQKQKCYLCPNSYSSSQLSEVTLTLKLNFWLSET